MSRNRREAEMKALYKEKYGDVLITELGGRKRDRRKMLHEQMLKFYQQGTVPEYQGGSLRDLYNNVRQGKLFDLLVGKSPQEISDMAARGETPYPSARTGRQDLGVHALTSKLLADRIGVLPARAIGVGNEVLGGLVSMGQGKGFFGEVGFDPTDLNANEAGFEASAYGSSPENRAYGKSAIGKSAGRPAYQKGTIREAGMGYSPMVTAHRDKSIGRTFMNAPMTVFGLGKSFLGGQMPRLDAEGNLVSTVPPAQGALGQTMGEVIFLNPKLDPATRRETLAHEKKHVEQGGRMSVGYPLLNALESLQLALRGKDPYEQNRFEQEAERARQEQARQDLVR